MALFKKQPQRLTREELIASQIEDLEQMIEKAPQRLQEERERARNHMPAPDTIEERERRQAVLKVYTRGEVTNEHKFQARNTVFFILLATTFISLCWWIYAELVRHGFFAS